MKKKQFPGHLQAHEMLDIPLVNIINFQPVFHSAINYDKTPAPDLITVVIQDDKNNSVLLVATMDGKAWQLTLSKKLIHLYSRSAKKVRCKGAERSGDYLEVVGIYRNCNSDSVLIKVKKLGKDDGVCHLIDENGKHFPACFSFKVL